MTDAKIRSRARRILAMARAVGRCADREPDIAERANLEDARRALDAMTLWACTQDAATLARTLTQVVDGPDQYAQPVETWIATLDPEGHP
jgi:ketosteroid isomerase-like protein